MKYWLLLLTIICCAHSDAAPWTDRERSYKVPVLSVSPEGIGSCDYAEFSLVRKDAGKGPLFVAIAEDTPSGVGESARASVWMAATVAALDRLDDLSGVKISVQLPGQIDGPSAGGVICLAILSALDGKDFPPDCAMTGAIMPDGTIGSVGGIASKMRAAAGSGAKRILIPAYLRFEKDAKSGQEVDLKRLASSLKLEFIPVENIAQAYRAAHRLTAATERRADRSALDLPEATEELLKQSYGEQLAEGVKLWDAIPADEKKEFSQDALFRTLLIGTREKGEQAYRSGRLLVACSDVGAWRLFLAARRHNEEVFGALKDADFNKKMESLQGKLVETMQTVPATSSLVAASRTVVQDSGIQLCGDYYGFQGMIGVMNGVQTSFEGVTADLGKTENKGDDRQRTLMDQAFVLRAVQFWLATCMSEASKTALEDNKRLAATLPPKKLTRDVAPVERLFFSAFLAAHNSFEKDVIRIAADDFGISDNRAMSGVADRDVSLAMYLPIARALQVYHRDHLTQKQAPADAQFASVVATHGYANGLARASGLITRWSQLEATFAESGELRYGRTDLLNYLLSSARENALWSIAECRKQGIPCIQPIAQFERAELERDGADEDKVNVLTTYWDASLQAKVLLMLFAPAEK